MQGYFEKDTFYPKNCKKKNNREFQMRKALITDTDNGHPERAFFQKFKTFGLGQTNWAEIL